MQCGGGILTKPLQLKLFLDEPTVSVSWAKRQLKCSEKPIYALIESGVLKAYRLSKSKQSWYRISYSSFVAYVDSIQKQYDQF